MNRPRPFHFEVDHDEQWRCGQTHTVTAWTTATSGLAVWHENPENTECVSHDCGWQVIQPAGDHSIYLAGVEDPEAAMRLADRLGRYADWTEPVPAAEFNEFCEDMRQRGEW